MPELPEVETIVRELQPVLCGKHIIETKILWPRTVQGDHLLLIKCLLNNKILAIYRRGKYLCFKLKDGIVLTIHLRMTGKLLLNPQEKDKNYIRVRFTFNDRTELYFVDMRKFGRIRVWSVGEPLLPNLGPEPLNKDEVLKALTGVKSTRPIKTLLLDQSVLAGIGNIYADETLFLAGIHPLTSLKNISGHKLGKLSEYIPAVLNTAIKNQGTTISDYRKSDRLKGGHQFYLKVYGLTGKPCPHCGKPIARMKISTRSSHFCSTCQPEL